MFFCEWLVKKLLCPPEMSRRCLLSLASVELILLKVLFSHRSQLQNVWQTYRAVHTMPITQGLLQTDKIKCWQMGLSVIVSRASCSERFDS